MAQATPGKARVVSGMRPTGRLHLGHLVGALKNWTELQDRFDCFYFVADWHALTSEYANTSAITSHALDNIAEDVDYDEYVELATANDAGQIAGERGNQVRESQQGRTMTKKYKELRAKAFQSCFIQ